MGCLMSHIISSAYLPSNRRYSILGNQTVDVEVTENPFALELATLFLMAARKNKKRGFLFVSKILGKHLPLNPFVGLLGGVLLGTCFAKQVYGSSYAYLERIVKALKEESDLKKTYEEVCGKPIVLPEQTLFIGFAETATALGHSMAALFKNASYVHTSRELIPELTSLLNCDEEHSHAVAHRCYLQREEVLRDSELVVLVDDEITTGRTALNMITEIQAKFPKREYAVAALLDWRSSEDQQKYKELEQRFNIKIHTVSLIKGKIAATGEPLNDERLGLQHHGDKSETAAHEVINLQLGKKLNVTSEDSTGYKNTLPYLLQTGRFGISDQENLALFPMCKEIGARLKLHRKGQKTLCLGTGEFMFIPMLISAYMGEGISYQSTTRSPIYPYPKPGYAIQSGLIFASIDDPQIDNYVYNIPANYYDEVYLFIERGTQNDRLKEILCCFKKLNIRLVLVYGNG